MKTIKRASNQIDQSQKAETIRKQIRILVESNNVVFSPAKTVKDVSKSSNYWRSLEFSCFGGSKIK